MGDRRGSQLFVEAVFLIALAAALGLAHLKALEIAGGMLVGWLVVAALEWASWRSKPHYGSGVPPRYYVPSVNLPPESASRHPGSRTLLPSHPHSV